jgi:acyl-CoA synthetase (AMP-forming)/AMP-acid ligase II
MIKTAGANVSPGEVEQAIAKLTGGAVAHVFGIPDAERGQVVAAVVALETGADFDETTLRRQLAAELSVYKIPKRFAAVSTAEIPLLPSGKVNMQELKRVFDAG